MKVIIILQKLLISLTLTAVFVSTARAADQVYVDPPIQPVMASNYDWSGAYIGAHIGYATGDASTTALDDGAFDNSNSLGYSTNLNPNGVFGGLQAGYNWQRGGFVAGVEADIGYLGVSDERLGYPDAPSGLTDTGMVVDYGWYGVLAGRVGFASNRTLFYGKGGLAIAGVNVLAGDIDSGGTTFDESDTTDTSEARIGYTIGGGVEHALNNGWSVKAEYMYMDFGSSTSTDPSDSRYKTDLDLHTIKVGFNYKF